MGRLRSLLVFVLVLVVADWLLAMLLGVGLRWFGWCGYAGCVGSVRLMCLAQFLRFCGFCCSVFMWVA